MLQLRFSNSAKPAMWLVAQKYTFGSQKDCDCVLEQAGVAPVHAEITVAGEVVTLVRMDATSAVSVNGVSVLESRQLCPGDVILLGDAELAIADPKSEGPRRDYSDRTSLRQAINVPAQVNGAREPTWHLRPLNTTLAKSEGFALIGTMLLGRSKECDICIPASHLSRKHAKFTVSDSGLTVEDLGSSNGTFINGSKIHRISLNHGDEVNFDTLRFRVEAKKVNEDVTSLRPALDETQIRQAISPNQIKKSPPSARKAPPVRPKLLGKAKTQQNNDSTADTIKLLLGALVVVSVVASLVWFLLN